MQSLRIKILVPGLMIAAVLLCLDGRDSEMFEKELTGQLPGGNDTILRDALSYEGERIFSPKIINRLVEKSGRLLTSRWKSIDKIEQMLYAISNASADGLNSEDYHLNDIKMLIQKISSSDMPDAEDVDKLELMLTDSFLLLSSHLTTGKTDPETIDPIWKVPRRKANLHWESSIDSTLESGSITGILQHLLPTHPDYIYLKSALSKYLHLKDEGGWGIFTSSLPKLEYGTRHPDVDILRKRLSITQGDIAPDSTDEFLFDHTLHDQVVIFQQRNGLNPDGVVGKSTRDALNITVEERIEAIEANLERWRWIADDLGERYIRVNIANFNLRVMESNKPVFESPVIVGQQYRQTPVFGSMLKYLILNPDWVVPPTILTNDILPVLIKDQSYLAKNNMKILNKDGTEIDPSAINWSSVLNKGFPYMIRQEPGLKSPLGRIKFVFPNEYDVYIHDTPSRSLFQQNIRTFSSGCIRISKAIELAEYLLKDDPEWSLYNLKETIDKGEKRIIVFKNPVPVYILYLTAWADGNGTAYFGTDIYNRDQKLIEALKHNQTGNINGSYLTGEIPVKNLKIR